MCLFWFLSVYFILKLTFCSHTTNGHDRLLVYWRPSTSVLRIPMSNDDGGGIESPTELKGFCEMAFRMEVPGIIPERNSTVSSAPWTWTFLWWGEDVDEEMIFHKRWIEWNNGHACRYTGSHWTDGGRRNDPHRLRRSSTHDFRLVQIK